MHQLLLTLDWVMVPLALYLVFVSFRHPERVGRSLAFPYLMLTISIAISHRTQSAALQTIAVATTVCAAVFLVWGGVSSYQKLQRRS